MHKVKPILLSLLVMALWGSLYPVIKLGYIAWGIQSDNTADILLFAAIRFMICGGVVSVVCSCKRKQLPPLSGKSILYILLIGLFSIVLHYGALYLGLSFTDSSKTALLKQAGSLLYICTAFIFIKEETFHWHRITGAIIGFLGIVAININSGQLTFGLGELLVLIASVCTVTANVISRRSVQTVSPYWLMGISQIFGGIALFAASLIMGGRLPQFSAESLLLMGYICTASIVSYLLWYSILKNIKLSNLLIVKFAEPVFACVFGAVLLEENIFQLQYLLAIILISAGIFIGNLPKKASDKLC